MSFGLGHGRDLDDAPGVVGVAPHEIPPLPDSVLTDRAAGRFDFRRWFPAPGRPVEIEIGSGKGTFLLEQAPRSPGTNFLGIEWEREFYLYAADRLRRRFLGERANVRMLCANGVDFLRWRCPDGLVAAIHLYFSDPWPKRRHHKNRVIQHEFLADAWRVLSPGGELRVVTDHDELWTWCEDHFRAWTSPTVAAERVPRSVGSMLAPDAPPFELAGFVPPEWVGDGQVVGTNYERKMCVGRAPHACVLRKLSAPAGRPDDARASSAPLGPDNTLSFRPA